MPAATRKPGVFVVPRDVARVSIERQRRTYYGVGLLLVTEIISSRGGREQTDRVRAAAADSARYWIVDLEPEPRIAILEPCGPSYRLASETRAGEALPDEDLYVISFDPVSLIELE